MGKKKQNKQPQQPMSPAKFLKERVRLLPIEKCYICRDLVEGTEGAVLVVRKHTGDKYTVGMYLVDKLCLGVKDASYHIRMDWSDYINFIDSFEKRFAPSECSYEIAHNWVWGAVGFAEDAGIKPCKEFALAQYVLAEDNEDVVLIEYDFGDAEGKHCLMANGRLEASTYLPTMRKNLGDDFSFYLGPHDTQHGPEDWDYVKNCPLFDDSKVGCRADDWEEDDDEEDSDLVEYHKEHPSYPSVLSLRNQDLPVLLSCSDFKLASKDTLDELLSREGLREDLEQYLLYNIGMTNDEAYAEDPSIYDDDQRYEPNLFTAFRLLAEVGDEGSIDVMLEGLRQWEKFNDYHYGDMLAECFAPALAKLAANRLDLLKAFAMEPGLEDIPHSAVFDAVWVIYAEHLEKRDEIIAWYKEVLAFAYEKGIEGNRYFSKVSISWALATVEYIGEKELLPDVKKLYDANLVNTFTCPGYLKMEQRLNAGKKAKHSFVLDIHDWMSWYVEMY